MWILKIGINCESSEWNWVKVVHWKYTDFCSDKTKTSSRQTKRNFIGRIIVFFNTSGKWNCSKINIGSYCCIYLRKHKKNWNSSLREPVNLILSMGTSCNTQRTARSIIWPSLKIFRLTGFGDFFNPLVPNAFFSGSIKRVHWKQMG